MANNTDGINQEWLNFWKKSDQPPWQLEKPNQSLLNHIDLLVKPSAKATVFVPLCGKSVDLLWLYQQGHNIVGIELSTLAIEGFFTESSIDYEKTTLDNNGLLYKSKDGRIKIFSFDLFDFKREHLDGTSLDAVWDRGSFIAMEPSQRARYVETVAGLIDPGTPYLLERMDHPDDGNERPYQFTVEEIKAFCDKDYECRELSEHKEDCYKGFTIRCTMLIRK